MDNNFTLQIIDKFAQRFTDVYNELDADRAKLLKYSPVLFKRWYYSALVNETTLTPSFIYNAGLGNSGVVCAPSIFPRISTNVFKDFIVKENTYSVKSHPVIKDLEFFINFCIPDIELDDDNLVPASAAEKITPSLSLSDPFYVDYLTLIAFSLKLIIKSAAIYSNKAAVSHNYMSFFKLRQEDALKKVVDETVKLSSKKITRAIPRNLSLFSEKGIVSLIKKPMPVDDIFKRVFSAFGVDIDYVWENCDDSHSQIYEDKDSVISSAFFFGIILDKWFITPFSEYLKIIEPIYCYLYNFEEEIKYLYDALQTGSNVNTALYSPCAFYSFTPVGKLLFSYTTSGGESGRHFNIPVTELVKLLNSENLIKTNNGAKTNEIETKMTFSFKVVCTSDKRRWIKIDAADYNTLHELHLTIKENTADTADNEAKYVDDLVDYCFYASETMTPFSKYAAPHAKGKIRKADETTIVELSLIKGSKMIYVCGENKYEIELLKCLPSKEVHKFPLLVKQSKYKL